MAHAMGWEPCKLNPRELQEFNEGLKCLIEGRALIVLIPWAI